MAGRAPPPCQGGTRIEWTPPARGGQPRTGGLQLSKSPRLSPASEFLSAASASGSHFPVAERYSPRGMRHREGGMAARDLFTEHSPPFRRLSLLSGSIPRSSRHENRGNAPFPPENVPFPPGNAPRKQGNGTRKVSAACVAEGIPHSPGECLLTTENEAFPAGNANDDAQWTPFFVDNPQNRQKLLALQADLRYHPLVSRIIQERSRRDRPPGERGSALSALLEQGR